MERLMKKIIYIVVFAVLFGTMARGQTVMNYRPGPADPSFRISTGEFYDVDKEMNRLEVYYQIFNSDLVFESDGDNFRADYTIIATVLDKKDIPIASQSRDKEIVLTKYQKTISYTDFRTGQINFYLEPGKYKVECYLADNNAKKKYKKSVDVELRNYDGRNPQLSGIEFVFAIDTLVYDSSFLKNNITVIPNVGRVFGEDTSSTLNYYFEIYSGKKEFDEITVETNIYDRKLKRMYHDTLSETFSNKIIAHYRQSGLRNLKSGLYYAEVVLKGRRDKVLDEIKEEFHIYWSPEAMVLNDPKTAVQQLKYIASGGEMKKIEKIENSGERLKAWNDFWKEKDPTPGTPFNEAKIDYYQRIEFANRSFTVLRREGWRTDRGMIYIMYGAPDQIEDYPFELETKAYQVWYYYMSGSKAREFLFVDEWGNNDYILQFPYDGLN